MQFSSKSYSILPFFCYFFELFPFIFRHHSIVHSPFFDTTFRLVFPRIRAVFSCEKLHCRKNIEKRSPKSKKFVKFAHFSRNYAVFLHVIVSHILHFLVQSWQVFYDFNEQLILFSSLFVMEIVNNEILWKNFQRSFEEMKSFWNLAGHVKIFRIELHRTNSCLQLLFLTILVKKFSFGDIQLLKRVQISHYFCPTL